MADISDVAMEPHHVIRTRISNEETIAGSGATYSPMDGSDYAGAPYPPIATSDADG